MGQYWKPTNVDKLEFLYSHDFDNGMKLMEHSYIRNNFVKVVERLLSPKGPWYKCRLCWAGGYMDPGLLVPPGAPLRDENGHNINLYNIAERNVISGRLESEGNDDIETSEATKKTFIKALPRAGRYLVNHTKKICIDLKAEDVNLGVDVRGNETWPIHPLPLLTSSGNGRGGRDYNGNKMNIVGSWAGDVISLEHKPMYKLNPPILFKENTSTSEEYQFVCGESENDIKQKEKEERKIKREKAKKEKEERERIEFEKSELAELLG